MVVAGCDVGSLTSKAVIMENGRIVNSAIIKSKARPWESADEVMEKALSDTDKSMNDIKYAIGTGYGREKIKFVNESLSEISCHGKGAQWIVPTARTVIDIGGQDCKVMKLDENANIDKFNTNDKCASGTGRFLEVMADILDLELSELGELSKRAKNPVVLASACTVWAQANIIQFLNDRIPIEDIAAGINNAMANRMSVLANNIGIKPDVCMTGGVAKNEGVVSNIENLLGIRIRRIRRHDPQIVGAIGAALFAGENINGGAK